MKSHLDAVPFEILVKINQHLGNQDRYQLCLVNRSLNSFFKNYIFYSLSFHSVEQVISSCKRLALEPFLFWKITSVSINMPFSNQCPYANFLQYCVNLRVFVIGEQFWESFDDTDGDVDMLVNLDSYPVITTVLELDIACAHTYGIEDLLVLLTKLPHLKQLTLRQLFLVAKPSDMEQVHALLPDLETLTLDYKQAFQPPLTFGALHPRRLEPLATICPAMKRLSIYHSGLWDEFTPWIYYIADKYPRLQSLDISFIPTWQNDHGYTNSINAAPLEMAIRVMVDSCRWLDSVRFENVWWATSFFRYRFTSNHLQQQNAATLRQVSVVASDVGAKTSTSTFNLISVGVLPTVTSLDLALHTESMMIPPLYMFQSFRKALLLTDLRLSTPRNRRTMTSLLWFLEFCPALRSLVLDNGSIDVHLNDDDNRWMANRKRKNTLSTYQLVRLVLTNCIFTNAIFDYLEKTCPDLNQISLTACLLHRSPSLRLWFPRHVFRSILINHVRVACLSDSASPIVAAHIDNPPTWTGINRPVEFITIQRHHIRPTAPCLQLGPCYIPNQHIFPTRSMKRRLFASGGPYQRKTQTFKVMSMTYRSQEQHSATGETTREKNQMIVMGMIAFFPLEFISTIKCMTQRELDYYDQSGCLHLPPDSCEDFSPSFRTSSYESNYSRWTTTEGNKRQKLQGSSLSHQLQEHTQHQSHSVSVDHAESSIQEQQHQRHHFSDRLTLGSHLVVNVYGITEVKVNGKWIVI